MESRDGCGLVVLDHEACINLLAVPRVGSLAVTDQALPVVLPVAYALDGHDLVMRVAEGSLLSRAAPGRVVAFCAYNGDLQRFGGWSVAVTGIAERIATPRDQTHRPYGPVGGWGGTRHPEVWLRLPTDLMTGRRLEPARRHPLSAAVSTS